MTASWFLSAALIAMIGFVIMPKKLHIFEILFVWMLFIFVQANYIFVAGLNLKRVEYSMELDKFWSYILCIVILNPILITGMLLAMASSSRRLVRACWPPIFAGLLTGLEYIAGSFGVLTHSHWRAFWSYAIWWGILLLAVISHRWYQRILHKELRGIL